MVVCGGLCLRGLGGGERNVGFVVVLCPTCLVSRGDERCARSSPSRTGQNLRIFVLFCSKHFWYVRLKRIHILLIPQYVDAVLLLVFRVSFICVHRQAQASRARSFTCHQLDACRLRHRCQAILARLPRERELRDKEMWAAKEKFRRNCRHVRCLVQSTPSGTSAVGQRSVCSDSINPLFLLPISCSHRWKR